MAWIERCALVLALGCGDDSGTGGETMASPSTTSAETGDPGTTDPDPGTTEGPGSSGTPPGSSGGELPEVDFETDIQPVINANCTCHLQGPSGTMTAPFLTMNPGMAHAELVGVAAMQVPALDRVVPNDLEGSYLWHKISETHLDVGGMGTRMPPVAALGDEDMVLFRAWILQGALP